MRIRHLLPLACAALLVPAGSAVAKDAEDPNEVVCKRERGHPTGSHLSSRAKRVCMTRAEWAEREEQAQRELRAYNEQSRGQPTEPGFGSPN